MPAQDRGSESRSNKGAPLESTESASSAVETTAKDCSEIFSHAYRLFEQRGWTVQEFQKEAWSAYLAGESGLIHSATGSGKTLAAWLGPVLESLADLQGADLQGTGIDPCVASNSTPHRAKTAKSTRTTRTVRANSTGATWRTQLQVLWITPLKALANDLRGNLQSAVDDIGLPWTVELRTGDTSSAVRKRQRTKPPHALITTPESLSILMSFAESHEILRHVRCVVVDEWHELLGTKRGVQLELCLAHLRGMSPKLRTWGLSATLGNLPEAMHTLLGRPEDGRLIRGPVDKEVIVTTLIPPRMQRFPWAGHLGTQLLGPVIDEIEKARTTLLFTNTRSQAELWFDAIATARNDWIDRIALHHGSIATKLRQRIEAALREGVLKCVVCTSSLDLGVDFSPVDQVMQVGSPKGIARLAQRAGRSGHRPGEPSRIICIPTHSFELVEASAARRGLELGRIESRQPLRRSLDVLVQHAMTLASGPGFDAADLFEEVRQTHAFAKLTAMEWQWALDFLTRGGNALNGYPEYHRVHERDGRYEAASGFIARRHRMAIGTITSDAEIKLKWLKGGALGSVEESFIARLKPGDAFMFSGRTLKLVQVKDMVAYVRIAKTATRAVPRWQGGRLPLSTELAESVQELLALAAEGIFGDAEMRSVEPLLELQKRWSLLPAPDRLVVESLTSREGHHFFIYTFSGRIANQGLAALVAYRIAKDLPATFALSANDYGIELLSATEFEVTPERVRQWLALENLTEDLLSSLNMSELARRQFRDIARIAGLVFQGFPGQGKTTRQIQASSGLIYDVLVKYDGENLLLDQAQREVLDQQLESLRMRNALQLLQKRSVAVVRPPKLTPLAFPLWAERLQSQVISTESARARIERMVETLERTADKTRPAAKKFL